MAHEDHHQHRRTYLKYAAAGVFAGLAGCDGGGSPTPTAAAEPAHAVPHPGNDAVPEAEATASSLAGSARSASGHTAKDNPSVALQHTPNGNQYCGRCSLYVPDETGDGFGACTTVAGKIHPCDFCLLFTAYEGDDAVSCGQA